MRKDVRFGLAIGGILLAVLVVYVLVVPGERPGERPPVELVDNGSTTPVDNTPIDTIPQRTTPGQTVDPAPNPGDGPVVQTPPQTENGAQWSVLLAEGESALRTGGRHGGAVTIVDPILPGPQLRGETVITQTPGPIGLSGTTRPANTARTHTVVKGDTLSSISQAAYGTPKLWQKIAAANPSINPNRLSTGTILNIPELDAVREPARPTDAAAIGGTGVAGTGAGAAGGGVSEHRAVSIDSTKEYRVQAHDSLQRISTKLYGKADRWEKIYELNKQTIGGDPAKLKIDMVLKLPEPPTAGTVRA